MANILWSNIFRKGESELQVITRMWRETPLFKNIPERHIAFLCEKMHLRDFKAGEVIFTQGDQGAGAILVLEGEVRVSAETTELALLVSGDFFGEIALAAPERRDVIQNQLIQTPAITSRMPEILLMYAPAPRRRLTNAMCRQIGKPRTWNRRLAGRCPDRPPQTPETAPGGLPEEPRPSRCIYHRNRRPAPSRQPRQDRRTLEYQRHRPR